MFCHKQSKVVFTPKKRPCLYDFQSGVNQRVEKHSHEALSRRCKDFPDPAAVAANSKHQPFTARDATLDQRKEFKRRPSAVRTAPGAHPGRYKALAREADQECRFQVEVVKPKPRTKVYPKRELNRKPPVLKPSRSCGDTRNTTYGDDFADKHHAKEHYYSLKEPRSVSTHALGTHVATRSPRPRTAPARDLCENWAEARSPGRRPEHLREGCRYNGAESLASESVISSAPSENYSLKEGFSGHRPQTSRNLTRYGKTYGKDHDPRFSQAKHASVVDKVGAYPHVHISTAMCPREAAYHHPCHFTSA